MTEFSLEDFLRHYETDVSDMAIRGKQFRFYVPRSLDPFLDEQDPFQDFPLWAKIWEASLVLADHLAGLQPEPHRRFLEIGCGLGTVGIVAAAFGHRLTMTEFNPDALQFARANALTNLPQPQPELEIVSLDWHDPELTGKFDRIVASEVIYRGTDFDPIEQLILTHLAPDGEVILAEGLRKTSMEFFESVSPRFQLRAEKKVLRGGDKEVKVILCRMKPRRD
jgi:SAM-dependent methyltransferase